MKILIDISGFLPRKAFGALTFTEGFLEALNNDKRFRQHKIVILSSKESINYFQNLKNLDFFEIKVPSNSFLRVVYLHLATSKIFNSINPDLIFSPLEISYPTKFPNVVYIHDLVSKYYINNYPKFNRIRNFFLWNRVKLSLKYSNLVLTPSNFTKNEILSFANVTCPIEVVKEGRPNGIIKNFDSKINFNRNNIFIPSYKAKHKPIIQLVYALSEIKKIKPSLINGLQLIFTGKEDNTTEMLKQRIKEIDKGIEIICTGFIETNQVNYLYSKSKIVLFISDYEGFGLPMIESDYFEVPIVCTDIPVFKEIKNNNSIFYEQNNYIDLAEKIIFALSSDNKYKSSYNRNWGNFNEELFNHFENLIQNKATE